MKMSGAGFKHVLLLILICKLYGAELNRNAEMYSSLNSENTIPEDIGPILQRNKRASANENHHIDISIKVSPSNSDKIINLFENLILPLNISNITIIDASITTVCNNTCICRENYKWSPEICTNYTACSSRTVGEGCQCVAKVPEAGICELTPETSTTTTASSAITEIIIPMQFRFNTPFPNALLDNTSVEYQNYSKNTSKVLTEAYKTFPGFLQVNLRNFSNGSIVVSYDVDTSTDNFTLEDLKNAKNNITDNLQPYNITPSSFVTFIGNTAVNSAVSTSFSDGDSVLLTCNATGLYQHFQQKFTTVWQLGNQQLERYQQTSLSFTATHEWNGTYSCYYTYENGLVQTQNLSKSITVYALPKQVYTYNITLEKSNSSGKTVNLKCCVDKQSSGYTVTLKTLTGLIEGHQDPASSICYIFNYPVGNEAEETAECVVRNELNVSKNSSIKISYIEGENILCNDTKYGIGGKGSINTIPCAPNEAGKITATCSSKTNSWTITNEDCVNTDLLQLLEDVKNINNNNTPGLISDTLPTVVQKLVNVSLNSTSNISSRRGLNTTIEILEALSKSVIPSVNESTMENFLQTASVLLEHSNQSIWSEANSYNGSSRLLQSLEIFARKYNPYQTFGEYNISTNNIVLSGTKIIASNKTIRYQKTFFNNNTVNIPEIKFSSDKGYILIVSIGVKILAGLLPQNINNDASNMTNVSINGILISTTLNESITINNISNSFLKDNATLNKANCVFWDFTDLKWKDDNCSQEKENGQNDTIKCNCNHLTPFSMLMSYKEENNDDVLNWITYIGLGISIASLLISLFIETLVWKTVTKNKTSYIRHVSIVNITISLLIADIWFIIGIVIQREKITGNSNDAACSTATFFIHFFYLALFFWMFVLGLFLFYRLIFIFHDMSRTAMLIIAFSVGYGSPLIIAVITIAVTSSEKYTQQNNCWLNWDVNNALLAFVIPALAIVAANFIFLLVVIIKIMRPTTGERPRRDEKSTMIKIARSVATLTPLLGLTWALGVATIFNTDVRALHIIFTILNAFQGLFILIFATLLDTKVREALKQQRLLSVLTSKSTRTTASQPSSGPLSRAIDNVFNKKRNAYRVSDGIHSSSNTSSRPYSSFS